MEPEPDCALLLLFADNTSRVIMPLIIQYVLREDGRLIENNQLLLQERLVNDKFQW